MTFPEVERARPAGYYDPPPDEEDEHLEPEEIEALFERIRSRLRRAAKRCTPIVPNARLNEGKR